MKRLDLLRRLLAQDCELRAGGRHSCWHNPTLNRRGAVPGKNDDNDRLARTIRRDLGVDDPKCG